MSLLALLNLLHSRYLSLKGSPPATLEWAVLPPGVPLVSLALWLDSQVVPPVTQRSAFGRGMSGAVKMHYLKVRDANEA